jgi:hypothetical protein
MDLFPLPLFPDGSLRESVVTTVWIGVFVISFFNLRFGWTYSGLVIPGYLVPLILTNPISAVITVVEGIIAYGLVYLVSEYLSRFGWWCNFFGRDRFFALLLSAVLVRVGMDGWCLPTLASWLQQEWNLTLDYQGAFHSFGLIIIALIANQFWKTGFWRGLAPFAITVGITFLIIRFVLMTLTNFNVGHMTYMYSNTATSLLASPKSYIILIVTGFVASRMNLRYGWEYSGILIPALLALQWYDPLKILSSLAEAAVVYLVSDRLLQTRFFRGVTMEGARKLLLFFNVAYAYRYCLGFLLPLISPGIVVNDYYGFAYLLSSLIALKMHSKHIVLRLSRATLQTSFVAAIAANLIGFWLASLFGSVSFGNPQPGAPMPSIQASADSMEMLTARAKLRLYRKRAAGSVSLPNPGELNRFQDALALIRKHAETGTPETLSRAQIILHQLHYTIEQVPPHRLCLREQEPNRGWGIYFIDLEQPNGLLLEVPAPLEEWSVVDSAVQLYRRLNASNLAIAGGGRFANKDGSADVLVNPSTPFEVFHHVFGRRNVLQIRGYTEQTLARLPGSTGESALYVKAELPRSLSLSALEGQIGNFRVVWKPAPLSNAQQRRTRAGFAELWLNRESRIGLKSDLAESQLGGYEPGVPENSLMLEWLLEQKRWIAKGGSDRYIPASPEEMLFVDEEILTPLLEAARTGYRVGGLTPQGQRLVRAINWSGWLLGYQVSFLHDASLGQDFLVMAESPQAAPRRYWGTFVIRLGESQPYAVQVPRPLFDLNSLEYGVHLFERLQAESLLLAGSHNEANQDQSSDALNFRNTANLFSLVNQVVMRQAHGQQKMAVQCRGFAVAPGGIDPPEVLLAFPDGIHDEALLTRLGRTLTRSLAADGFRLQFVDGSPLTAGYEISCVPQAQYVIDSARQEFAILWLSPTTRDVFRSQDNEYPLQIQLKALGIPIRHEELNKWLKARLNSDQRTKLPSALKSALDQYVATLDIVSLQKAVEGWPNFEFSALVDRNSGQLLLVISEHQSDLPVVLNLRPREAQMKNRSTSDGERIDSFLATRSRWLEWAL